MVQVEFKKIWLYWPEFIASDTCVCLNGWGTILSVLTLPHAHFVFLYPGIQCPIMLLLSAHTKKLIVFCHFGAIKQKANEYSSQLGLMSG